MLVKVPKKIVHIINILIATTLLYTIKINTSTAKECEISSISYSKQDGPLSGPKVIWKYHIKERTVGIQGISSAVYNDKLFFSLQPSFGSANSVFSKSINYNCVDLKTGKKKWISNIDGLTTSEMVIFNKLILVAAINNIDVDNTKYNLLSIDAANGNLVNSYDVEHMVKTIRLIGSSLICVSDKSVFSLSLTDEKIIWKILFDNRIDGFQLCHDFVLVYTNNEALVFNSINGEKLYKRPSKGIDNPPIFGNHFLVKEDDCIRLFDIRNGEARSKLIDFETTMPINHYVKFIPTVNVIICEINSSITAIDHINKSSIWKIENAILNHSIANDKRLFHLTENHIFAYNISTGGLSWEWKAPKTEQLYYMWLWDKSLLVLCEGSYFIRLE